MTAEIVDLRKYREQKKRSAGKSRRTTNRRRTRARKILEEAGVDVGEEALADERLDDDGGTRGGKPA